MSRGLGESLVTSLMRNFIVMSHISTRHGPSSSTKSVDELEFTTNNKGDLPGIDSQLEPALFVIRIPSGMYAQPSFSCVELASEGGEI